MKKEWFDKILENEKEIQVIITLEDLYNELYEICDRVHSSCDSECPVYHKCIETGEFSINKSNDCKCFRNGKAMFVKLKEKRTFEVQK